MTIKIYHNPRCSKSRQAIQLLQDKGLDFETVLYLEKGLTKDEIVSLVGMLQCDVVDVFRKKEAEYKALGLDQDSVDDADRIEALVQCPKLLERPIVVHNDKAVIARPTDNIETIL